MKCVLGVLKSPEGLLIREEMLEWLSPLYEVIEVCQDVPGALFEYPALALAFEIASKTDRPVLYLHTKGAAFPTEVQGEIRAMWKNELGIPERAAKYVDLADVPMPRLSTPIMSPNKDTWFNAFFVNAAAGRILRDTVKPSEIRHVFEFVARDTPVDVVSPFEPCDGVPIFTLMRRLAK